MLSSQVENSSSETVLTIDAYTGALKLIFDPYEQTNHCYEGFLTDNWRFVLLLLALPSAVKFNLLVYLCLLNLFEIGNLGRRLHRSH